MDVPCLSFIFGNSRLNAVCICILSWIVSVGYLPLYTRELRRESDKMNGKERASPKKER